MKTNLIILIPLLLLSACGKDKQEAQNAGNTVEVANNETGGAQGNFIPTEQGSPEDSEEEENAPEQEVVADQEDSEGSSEDSPEETPEEEVAEENTPEENLSCAISDLNQDLPSGCKEVRYGSRLLAGASHDQEGITIVASKRNGSKEGSRWFNSSLQLQQAKNVSIPSELRAEGNGGNGHKVYILINGTIDCAWTSHGAHRYRNPVCKMGATRNPSSSEAFNGGSNVNIDAIPAIQSLEMTVNGSQGNGVLTTVTAEFSARLE